MAKGKGNGNEVGGKNGYRGGGIRGGVIDLTFT